MGLNIKNNEINECIETIRRQVNEIGYLVDEFSSFARLPDPDLKNNNISNIISEVVSCLLYTSPSPRDRTRSRMPSSA